MGAICEHPDCDDGATMVVSSALGAAAVCDAHYDAVATANAEGQAEFAEWYRNAALDNGLLA